MMNESGLSFDPSRCITRSSLISATESFRTCGKKLVDSRVAKHAQLLIFSVNSTIQVQIYCDYENFCFPTNANGLHLNVHIYNRRHVVFSQQETMGRTLMTLHLKKDTQIMDKDEARPSVEHLEEVQEKSKPYPSWLTVIPIAFAGLASIMAMVAVADCRYLRLEQGGGK